MYPPNTFAQKRASKLRNEQGNGECRIGFFFFDENWAEKIFWQKLSQHAAQMNGVPSINTKILAFRILL